jgi:hypothetical protein
MIGVKTIFFLFVFVISASIYALTLCPTVEFIDSGELAMACKYLGIAHPTGYPLYTILGRLAVMISRSRLILGVNIMSLLLTAFSSGVLFLLIWEVNNWFSGKIGWRSSISASAALFVAFSPVWWAQSTTNEVYSLNLLLICLSILGFFKYLEKSGKAHGWLIFSAYSLGLSMTNHLSAVYLIPGFVLILSADLLKKRINIKTLMWLSIFFCLPITLYFFLPLRAAHSPFLNWGGVDDPFFLFKHISGWQYRVWMFADADISVALNRLSYAGKLIINQFGWFGLILAALGIIPVFRRKPKPGIFAVSIVLLNLIYVINYQISDIDSYYLPIIIVISLFMASGIFLVAKSITGYTRAGRSIRYLFAVILIIIPVSSLSGNFHLSDRSEKTFARQGALDLLESMEPGGFALIENWDFYSPWLYLRFGEGTSPDKVLLDKELMRRSWYIDFIRRTHPGIYERSKREFEEFLIKVQPFERNRQFDPMVIDRAYYGMLQAVMINESSLRNVYTNIAGDQKFLRLLSLVPDGILFRLHKPDEFLENRMFDFNSPYWGNRSVHRELRIGHLLSYYRRAFRAREVYCRQFGRSDEAEYYGDLAAHVRTIISEIKK